MAVELATGYVSIVPSTRGFQRKLETELRGLGTTAGAKLGDEMGGGFAARFASAARTVVAPVTRMLSDIATGVAVTGAAFAATSLFKGWDRLTTIQDSMRTVTIQLGDATTAGTLLDQVLNIVKGTPFPLDQFAAAAANLVSMGVEAQKIPTYLTAIGEASATRGKQASEFAQRLAVVFGQVSAQSRILGQDVNQFAEAGVNALAILGNHFGLTTNEMRDMISTGTVPAGEALDALAAGIINGSNGINGATVKLGGTMAGLGKELSGASANFGTAMARFGASIIAPFSPGLTQGFGLATKLLDDLGGRIGALAAQLVASPGFQAFLDWLSEIPNKIGPLLDRLSGLRDLVVPLGVAFAALGSGGISKALGPLGALIPVVNPLVAAFAALVIATPELRDAFVGLGQKLGPILSEIGRTLLPVFRDAVATIVPSLKELVIAGGNFAVQVLPKLAQAIGQLLPVFAGLFIEIAPAAVEVLRVLADIITKLPTPLLAAGVAFLGISHAVGGVGGITDKLGAMGKLLSPAGILGTLAVGTVVGLTQAFDDQAYAIQINIDKIRELTDVEYTRTIAKLLELADKAGDNVVVHEAFEKVLAADIVQAKRFIDALDAQGVKTDWYRDKLIDQAKAHGDSATSADNARRSVDELLESVGRTPDGKRIVFDAETTPGFDVALAQLREMLNSPDFLVGVTPLGVPRTAVGGIFDVPQLRVFAEAGSEAVLPLNDPARSFEILTQTGLFDKLSTASAPPSDVRGGGPLIGTLVVQTPKPDPVRFGIQTAKTLRAAQFLKG